jgi:hypothetical protein
MPKKPSANRVAVRLIAFARLSGQTGLAGGLLAHSIHQPHEWRGNGALARLRLRARRPPGRALAYTQAMQEKMPAQITAETASPQGKSQ